MTETNPEPPMNNVDPTLIVKAPCCQGDITVFGANAGQNGRCYKFVCFDLQ